MKGLKIIYEPTVAILGEMFLYKISALKTHSQEYQRQESIQSSNTHQWDLKKQKLIHPAPVMFTLVMLMLQKDNWENKL